MGSRQIAAFLKSLPVYTSEWYHSWGQVKVVSGKSRIGMSFYFGDAQRMPQGSPSLSVILNHNVLLYVAFTASVGLCCVVLIFRPELILQYVHQLSVRSYEELLVARQDFYLDILIIWLIGLVFIFLDIKCRRIRAQLLVRWLFVGRHGVANSPPPSLLIGTFLASFIVAPALTVVYLGRFIFDAEWLFIEDGPTEYATAFGFLCAAILLSISAFRARSKREDSPLWYFCFLSFLSVVLALVALEEISWGQRIFNLETPDVIAEINLQNELNFHNIFTSDFIAIYLLSATLLFAVAILSCWSAIQNPRQKIFSELSRFFPDGSLIFLFALLLIFSPHPNLYELVESLATLVVLLYAMDIYAGESDKQRDSSLK